MHLKVWEEAAALGAMHILQFIYEADEGEDRVWRGETNWGGQDAARAAAGGHSHVVKWLYDKTADVERDDEAAVKAAVASGDVQLVAWLLRIPEFTVGDGVHDAAANGHFNMVRAIFNGFPSQSRRAGVLLKAAENGHLDIVRLIVERDWNDESLDSDSDSEYDEMGYHRFHEGDTRPKHITCAGCEAGLAIHAAAVNGHVEVAKYLRARVDTPLTKKQELRARRRRSRTQETIASEVGHGNHAQPVSHKTMFRAAERGHLGVVKWLYSEFSISEDVNLFAGSWFSKRRMIRTPMDAAATNGHLDVVRYLHGKTQEYELESSRKPQRKSDPIIESMFGKREKRVSIKCTTEAMDGAAANNNLDVVKWLHRNRTEGCTTFAMDRAAGNGHLAMIPWLHENRRESCTARAMGAAAINGNFDIIQWLHQNTSAGCTTKVIDFAATFGRLDIVKWLHRNRTEGCTTTAMDGAAGSGRLDIVQWLHQDRTEGCSEKAMVEAARNGHVRVIEWLLKHRPGDCAGTAIDAAALAGEFEVVLFLNQVQGEILTESVAKDPKVNGCPGLGSKQLT